MIPRMRGIYRIYTGEGMSILHVVTFLTLLFDFLVSLLSPDDLQTLLSHQAMGSQFFRYGGWAH